jgi:hypothetical protein
VFCFANGGSRNVAYPRGKGKPGFGRWTIGSQGRETLCEYEGKPGYRTHPVVGKWQVSG